LTAEQRFAHSFCRQGEPFMRTLSTCAVVASSILVVVAACQPKQDDAPAPGYGYPPGQAPPPGYTPPGQAPAPQYAPTAAPPATVAPTPGPVASGEMAVPGPIAFQCKDDVPCGTHHCNLKYGKCAFPCQSAADCLSPNSCMTGFCVPAPPAAH
jgi:hypothetical protein